MSSRDANASLRFTNTTKGTVKFPANKNQIVSFKASGWRHVKGMAHGLPEPERIDMAASTTHWETTFVGDFMPHKSLLALQTHEEVFHYSTK